MKLSRLLAFATLAVIASVVRPERTRAPSQARPQKQSRGEHPREIAAPPGPKAATPDRARPGPWLLLRPNWRAVLVRVYKNMNDNRLLAVAAGVVFYGLLALFPALTALVSLYGLLADPATLHERLSLLSGILPQGAIDIGGEQLARLAAHRGSALSLGFVGGLGVALWSANAGAKAIMDGLNVAYGETEKRGLIALNLVGFAFTLGAIAAAICAVAAIVIVPAMLHHLGLGHGLDALIGIGRWPALLALVTVGLSLLYRYGPSLAHPQWTWLFPGNVIAAFAWLAASALFSWYIAHFGTYDATYGSLGAAIGMMTWMWISMIIILLGAELNAQIEREYRRDPPQPGRAFSHPAAASQ
jgi:membrane protein